VIPRLRLAHLPTPIEAMPRLSAELRGPRLWIKRDDLTGAGVGGNKVRKLEYLLAEAQANGARTLITTGAAQSNHCRQTAALAAQMNFRCKLVLSGNSNESIDGNLLLDRLFGAEIIWAKEEERNFILQDVFKKSWKSGERPFLIPLGGSTPIGTLGYASAFEEYLVQNVRCDWIVVASSSGGTQAGLELGSRKSRWNGTVIGINVGSEFPDLAETISTLATEASDRVGETIHFNKEDIQVREDYHKSGYGNPTNQEIDTIQLFARLEGILLDPVYTARAAAGMIDLIRNRFFQSTESVLFWHTGGIPAIFSNKYSKLILAEN